MQGWQEVLRNGTPQWVSGVTIKRLEFIEGVGHLGLFEAPERSVAFVDEVLSPDPAIGRRCDRETRGPWTMAAT